MTDWFDQHANDDQKRWVAALESGEWKQTKGTLHRKGGGYCCLGVACKLLLGEPDDFLGHFAIWGDDGEAAPKEVVAALKLRGTLGESAAEPTDLASLNDSGSSFKAIAKMIRATPWEWLTNIPEPEDAA